MPILTRSAGWTAFDASAHWGKTNSTEANAMDSHPRDVSEVARRVASLRDTLNVIRKREEQIRMLAGLPATDSGGPGPNAASGDSTAVPIEKEPTSIIAALQTVKYFHRLMVPVEVRGPLLAELGKDPSHRVPVS